MEFWCARILLFSHRFGVSATPAAFTTKARVGRAGFFLYGPTYTTTAPCLAGPLARPTIASRNPSIIRLLELSDNPLSGPIPAALGNLVNLQDLDLGYTMVSGAIPAELGNLVNLRVLYLNNTMLSGPLPRTLTNGTSYTFHVRAVNHDGLASAPSAPASATPGATAVPAVPPIGLLVLAVLLGAGRFVIGYRRPQR